MSKKKTDRSISNIIKALWEENFFSEPRGLAEISQAIAIKGFHFSSPTLSTALIRVIRSASYLNRAKKSGKWKYIQKYPVSLTPEQSINILSKYDFHPRVKEVALKQFKDGNFKESIQNALVEVVDQVKIKTRHPKNANGRDLDGDDLMNYVFGCDNQEPKIKFNALETSLDKAEQRGLMNLFKGIVGIRDKKAHLNFIQNDPIKTIEYLGLASLLLRLLDEHASMH